MRTIRVSHYATSRDFIRFIRRGLNVGQHTENVYDNLDEMSELFDLLDSDNRDYSELIARLINYDLKIYLFEDEQDEQLMGIEELIERLEEDRIDIWNSFTYNSTLIRNLDVDDVLVFVEALLYYLEDLLDFHSEEILNIELIGDRICVETKTVDNIDDFISEGL